MSGSPRHPLPVVERIVGHARVSPGRSAVSDPTQTLDYAALRRETAGLAAGLLSRGVRPGDRVAIHLTNSADFVLVALAVLRVGAVFVPLAAGDPDARLRGIVDDCAPIVVVTADPESAGPASVGPRLLHPLAVPLGSLRTPGGDVGPLGPDPQRPVYAIYTSGTTGTPKGVLVTEGAFTAAVNAAIDALELDGATRTLCVSAFHFDGSFATLFPTLVAGGLVVIPRRDSLLFARTFVSAVARHGITYSGFSPSYLRLILDSGRADRLAGTSLRTVALGGEAAVRADVETLRSLAPDVRVFNRYGPTETVIAVTHHEVAAAPAGVDVAIGRPHRGVDFFLLDDDGGLIDEADAVGELWIGGEQLMAGYWGEPELTATVLRPDAVPGRLVYRTGDLVRRSADGLYHYVDRVDRVVKRSGVRISLVELTGVLRSLPGVSAAACTLYEGDSGGPTAIVAFVVVSDARTAEDVRREARLRLPPTMLPDRVEIVASLPLTPAGKVDERRLLADAGLRARRRAVVPAG